MSTKNNQVGFVSIVPGAKRPSWLAARITRPAARSGGQRKQSGRFRGHRARREAPFVVCGTDHHDGFAITMSTKNNQVGFVGIVPGAKRPSWFAGRITT